MNSITGIVPGGTTTVNANGVVHGGTGSHSFATPNNMPTSGRGTSSGFNTDLMAMLQQDREFALQSAKMTNEFNAKEAEKSREWSEYMSNTSHQREVKDLIAAGLNPVLSANNGANAYQAAMASGVKPDTPSGANALSNIMAAGITASAMQNVAAINAGSALAVANENLKKSVTGSAWYALEHWIDKINLPINSNFVNPTLANAQKKFYK